MQLMNLTTMKAFVVGSRPKTLLAAIIPPLVAFFYAKKLGLTTYCEDHLMLLIFCLLSAVFIQIATNLFNDALDFEKGADKNRVGPIRITNDTSLPPRYVKKMASFTLTLAALLGIPLIIQGGFPIFFFGAISLYLAYGYTGGPYPLAYKGLGELFVFIFFGLFAVVGSFYIFTLELNQSIIYLGCTFGFLACTLIAINNLRDRASDLLVSKRTLATLIPERFYKNFIYLLLVLPYLTYYLSKLSFAWPIIFCALITLRLFYVVTFKTSEKLNPALAIAGLQMIAFFFMSIYG